MHEVLVNRLGSLSLPRKSVVRLTDRPDMTLDVYRGRKTTIQQHHLIQANISDPSLKIILQGVKKIWNGHEKLTDGQTDGQTEGRHTPRL